MAREVDREPGSALARRLAKRGVIDVSPPRLLRALEGAELAAYRSLSPSHYVPKRDRRRAVARALATFLALMAEPETRHQFDAWAEKLLEEADYGTG